MSDRQLYHFTSERGAQGISEDGEIRPALHNVIGEHLVWLTSEPSPKASVLGLTRRRRGSFTEIDRMAHRFVVNPPSAVHWPAVRDDFPAYAVEMLESAKGCDPESWFVSRTAVPVSQPAELGHA